MHPPPPPPPCHNILTYTGISLRAPLALQTRCARCGMRTAGTGSGCACLGGRRILQVAHRQSVMTPHECTLRFAHRRYKPESGGPGSGGRAWVPVRQFLATTAAKFERGKWLQKRIELFR